MNRYIKGIDLILTTLSLLLLLCACNTSNRRAKQILLIHSFEEGRESYGIFNKELSEELKRRGVEADIHTFYLDCERVSTEREPQQMRDYLDTVQRVNPDLILVNDDQATYTLMACGHPLVKKTPIVFAGVNYPNQRLLEEHPNATGWYDKQDFVENIRFIHTLFGRLTIRIAYDRTALGKLSFLNAFEQIQGNDNITIIKTHLSNIDIKEGLNPDKQALNLLQSLTKDYPGPLKAPKRDDWGMVQFTPFRLLSGSSILASLSGMESSTIYLDTKYDHTSEAMQSLTNYPSIAAHNEPIQYSPSTRCRFIGGYLTPIETQAREQAQTAAEILKGRSSSEIAIRESAKEHILIWGTAKAWGMSYKDIPSYVRVIGIPFQEKHKTLLNWLITAAFILIIGIASALGKMYTREERFKKRAQEDLIERNNQLMIALEKAKESDKMKSAFLANMSHEIRTPLNAIVGFSNILHTDNDLEPEERTQFLDLINTNSDLLLNLINDILDLSRIESGRLAFNFSDCNLNDLLRDIYETYLRMMPPQVTLRIELPSTPVMIHTDKNRLTQVVTNFLNNAVKFTTQGYILLGYTFDEAGEMVHIFVEDTGKGIAKEKQALVFKRFTKLDEFAQGTGLGLSICKVITNRFNGQIAVTSEEGRGSRFTVSLPLTPEERV